MICPHCGYSLDDGVAFCIYCGTRLGKYAVADGSAAETGAVEVPQQEAVGNVPADGQPSAADSGATGDVTPDSAWNVVGDYSEEQVAGPDAAESSPSDATVVMEPAGEAPAADSAEVEPVGAGEAEAVTPVAPVPASEGRRTRLHDEDSLSRRMGDAPVKEERKSRKGLAAAVLGVLLLAGVAVGAAYVVPNITGPAPAPTESTSGSSGDSSSSSASDSNSSSNGQSSSTEGAEDQKPETKRGSTLANAMNPDNAADAADAGDGDAAGSGEGAGDGGAAAGSGAAPAGADAAGGSGGGAGGGEAPTNYPVFAATGATATSTSPTEGSTPHGPDLVLDGVPETAWNTNMSGVGESITISTGSLSTVNGIRIMGGYNKISYNGTDLYYANSRPRDILVEYEGGSREFTMADLKREFQDIAINSPATTTWIKITIKSVYPGNAYDDCCISDIQVY